MSRELRQELIETALAMNASGINQGTSGNLSLRTGDGMMITPSGIRYSSLEPEDIVQVAMDGACAGHRAPSSEWRIHRDIYREREDARAIVHAHPEASVTLAALRRPIPAFHYMVAVAGGKDIRCADYATFGTQDLSHHVLAALNGRKACLMANHGLICLERNLTRALDLAIEVEHLASAYRQCLALGDPVILDDAEMERVLKKFSNYGSEV